MEPGLILITGAAGRIGSVLRAEWRNTFQLRLLDTKELGEPAKGEEVIKGDLSDFQFARRAMEGVDVVVHLAAIPNEEAFTRLMEANVAATFNVFEAARECGVRRLVFASTNHVTGFYPRSQRVGPTDPFRPDSIYAVTKVFGEALGRLYVDKWGLDVICLRIGAFGNRPTSVHTLSMWLSERDAVQLFTKAIMAGDVGFLIVYGLSRSRWSSWDNPGAALLAYVPLDDADDAADEDLKREAEGDGQILQGGPYTRRQYWHQHDV